MKRDQHLLTRKVGTFINWKWQVARQHVKYDLILWSKYKDLRRITKKSSGHRSGWTSSHKVKGHRFCVRKATNYVSHSNHCFSPSLSPSLPFSLNINKWNLKKKIAVICWWWEYMPFYAHLYLPTLYNYKRMTLLSTELPGQGTNNAFERRLVKNKCYGFIITYWQNFIY